MNVQSKIIELKSEIIKWKQRINSLTLLEVLLSIKPQLRLKFQCLLIFLLIER